MIRLRPHYLYHVLRQLDAGDVPVDSNSLADITQRLVACGFQEEIRLVRGFADTCRDCPRHTPDSRGSLWGGGFRCDKARTPERINEIEDQMRSILYDLELRFNDVMRADKLFCRAIERRPFHYFHMPQWQAAYERGVHRFVQITGVHPRIPAGLLAQRQHYVPGHWVASA